MVIPINKFQIPFGFLNSASFGMIAGSSTGPSSFSTLPIENINLNNLTSSIGAANFPNIKLMQTLTDRSSGFFCGGFYFPTYYSSIYKAAFNTTTYQLLSGGLAVPRQQSFSGITPSIGFILGGNNTDGGTYLSSIDEFSFSSNTSSLSSSSIQGRFARFSGRIQTSQNAYCYAGWTTSSSQDTQYAKYNFSSKTYSNTNTGYSWFNNILGYSTTKGYVINGSSETNTASPYGFNLKIDFSTDTASTFNKYQYNMLYASAAQNSKSMYSLAGARRIPEGSSYVGNSTVYLPYIIKMDFPTETYTANNSGLNYNRDSYAAGISNSY